MYSYRIEQAIRASAILHKDQLRKGSMPFPYITHLVATAFTILDYTNDEDVVIAALLHDTLEDTDYTLEELQEDFGGRVRELVEAVTEPASTESNKLSWRDKKTQYTKQLKVAPKDAVLIAAVDKIHNFRTAVEDYYDSPERFIKDFGNNFDERIDIYQSIANVINNRLEGAILAEFNHVFGEYKEFISGVQIADDNKYN